ncbi:hypothetical protein BDZ91DRAFT_719132 [Kalaharituber pfeilii]|nr:hypothetical protein BDZ91DRAFT_719132 [Kalaharituber pfeilii]
MRARLVDTHPLAKQKLTRVSIQEDDGHLADSGIENQDLESGESNTIDALVPFSYGGKKTRSVISIPERLRRLTFRAE